MEDSRSRPSWLTLDAVARYPRPGMSAPGQLAFSPDGRLVTYLFSERGDLIRDLWAVDVETGERRVLARAPEGGTTDANVNPEEALRRERQRVREGGITLYTWAKSADRLLVPINGQLFTTSSRGEPLRLIAPAEQPAVDARLTPDGQRIVFVRARELWVADVATTAVQRLTVDASDTVSNGLAEFIAQEEMGRSAGFWIAPDGASVAYAQVDEGHIPPYPIVHQDATPWRVEHHRYPFPGAANARVRLGVVSLAGGPTRGLELGPNPDVYLARVDWGPDGQLYVQIESRDQRRLELWRYDVVPGQHSAGSSRVLLLADESEWWVNLHNDFRVLESGPGFIWSAERAGFRHLALHGPDGQIERALTSGDWPVDHVVHVDEEREWVYFLAGRETPVERHLYRVPLVGGEAQRLTDRPGYHGATFAADGSRYVHTFESRTQPPTVLIRSVDDRPSLTLHASEAAACAPGLAVPEIVELPARDGTELYGAIYGGGVVPSPQSPVPTIVAVYGGPHAQTVTDTWGLTVDLRAQYLASLGYLVFKLDNRGSARRGHVFERMIHHALGGIEVQDQIDGVRWLVAHSAADPDRVGVYGWSYGGYMAALCLLTAPDVFKVGVAGAPVSDWDGYDTHYTERYMGTPADNPDGYRKSSALTYASVLQGHLLVIHGMIDENVHFRHTARLISALQNAGRPCDVLVFPGERHMPRNEAGRRYLEERVVTYFRDYL